jgi:hypothetical protein
MLYIDIPPRLKKKGRALKQFPGEVSPEFLEAFQQLRDELPRRKTGQLQPYGLLLELLMTDENVEVRAARIRLRQLVQAKQQAASTLPGRS